MTTEKTNSPLWIFYDFLLSQGGAEKTTILLQQALGGHICVAYTEEDNLLSYETSTVKCISKKQTSPGLPTLDGLWSFYTKTKFLLPHTGTALFSGSNAVLAACNHPIGENILYCHTIPRFAYDMRKFYRERLPFWKRLPFDALCLVTRASYRHSLTKMDTILVNSRNVQERLKKYTGYDSEIVYPPVDTKKFSFKPAGNYYLSTSRLEEFKRVDVIIKAFLNMPDKRLIIASSGSHEAELRVLAGDAQNIQFAGWIEDDVLQNLIENCIASIYIPIDEDFGISPVESMAAGKPVIGVNEGGLLETVLHKKTGYLCDATPDELITAVQWLTAERAKKMQRECENCAAKFDDDVFIKKMKTYILGSTNNSRKLTTPT
ncbi:MAG: glycosyltransferase [Halodesulfovibrio sp.]|uniref:glycosyltransferase n=1 Tax=Halodesulfovibrio sp. TaxID=1912772 RepID=UPI00359D116A